MYNDERRTILSIIKNIGYRLLDMTEIVLLETILFVNCSVDAYNNTKILNVTIEYILTRKRFHESLLYS